jgi:hypothetical protein
VVAAAEEGRDLAALDVTISVESARGRGLRVTIDFAHDVTAPKSKPGAPARVRQARGRCWNLQEPSWFHDHCLGRTGEKRERGAVRLHCVQAARAPHQPARSERNMLPRQLQEVTPNDRGEAG